MKPSSRARLPRLGWWRRALVARYGARGRDLVQAVDAEYRALIAQQPPGIEQNRPVLRVVGVLDRLGVPFTRLRRSTRWLVPRAFPPAGFAVGWEQDDDGGLRFEVTACFYLRVLRHYGAPELTGVFCYGDQLVFDRMPRAVRFTRTGTLATGAPRCDFLLEPATASHP